MLPLSSFRTMEGWGPILKVKLPLLSLGEEEKKTTLQRSLKVKKKKNGDRTGIQSLIGLREDLVLEIVVGFVSRHGRIENCF